MATTTLTLVSNRLGAHVSLVGTVTTVAADAQINERFILPVGFGDLWIRALKAVVFSFSGAYVAPAPAYDGLGMGIIDSAEAATADELLAERFVHSGTSSTRPTLSISKELFSYRIFRQAERAYVQAPILAGAGVTVSVQCFLMGLRTKNS